jgi:hypothetical protein
MKGSRFEGQFTEATGYISGELSADGKRLTGVYKFTNMPSSPGTWNATKM